MSWYVAQARCVTEDGAHRELGTHLEIVGKPTGTDIALIETGVLTHADKPKPAVKAKEKP